MFTSANQGIEYLQGDSSNNAHWRRLSAGHYKSSSGDYNIMNLTFSSGNPRIWIFAITTFHSMAVSSNSHKSRQWHNMWRCDTDATPAEIVSGWSTDYQAGGGSLGSGDYPRSTRSITWRLYVGEAGYRNMHTDIWNTRWDLTTITYYS